MDVIGSKAYKDKEVRLAIGLKRSDQLYIHEVASRKWKFLERLFKKNSF